MTEELKIGGYTLAELKVVQNAVRRDASKVVSDAIDKATSTLDAILSLDNGEAEPFTEEEKADIIAKAKFADEQLELAETISSISGVEFYLPYSTDWDNDGYSYKLESADNEELMNLVSEFSNVFEKLDRMEIDSYNWNTSRC